MLPKAQLTSYFRMSGSRWVTTPQWLSRLWRYFLYSSFVYSWHLFLISYSSVRPIPFLSFIVPIFAWNVPWVSLIFLKRSLVFPILFSSISLHWSLKKAFLSLLAILWNSAFKCLYLSFSPSLNGKWMGKKWKQWETLLWGAPKSLQIDGDCSHEIKSCLLLGRRAMTNLYSILKSRDITLPAKACLVKAMVFPVVMYGFKSWTVRKAAHWRVDAFELWC